MLRKSSLNLASPVLKILQRNCSGQPNDIGWSSGEKEKPISWRHKLERWYKIEPHLIYPHNLDPNDPKQKYPYKRDDGGIQYFNFVYYPRNEEEKDPPITPTPLLFVYRINSTRFRPYWEKNIIKKLGLDGKKSSRATVCKNIPEVNAMLWQVKHLVKVLPLKIPENLPKDANSLHCFIKENGEMVYDPTRNVPEAALEHNYPKIVDKYWIGDQTRLIYDRSLNLEF